MRTRWDDEGFDVPPGVAAAYAALIAIGIVLPPIVFTDTQAATSTLQRQGYSQITIRGYEPFGCRLSDEDWRTSFKARSPEDAQVTGVVCQSTTRRGTIIIETTSDPRLTPVTPPPLPAEETTE